MKKFSLETLLKVRDHRVKTGQMELAQLEKQLIDKSVFLKNLEKEMEETSLSLRERRSRGEISGDWMFIDYQEELLEKWKETRKNIERLTKSITHKKEELMQALQERKIVEKLKEKQYSRSQKLSHR